MGRPSTSTSIASSPSLENDAGPGGESLVLLLKSPLNLFQGIGTAKYLFKGVFVLGPAQKVE